MLSTDICLHVESREANSLKYHACGLDLEMYYRVCSSAIVSLADNCHRWPPLLTMSNSSPKLAKCAISSAIFPFFVSYCQHRPSTISVCKLLGRLFISSQMQSMFQSSAILWLPSSAIDHFCLQITAWPIIYFLLKRNRCFNPQPSYG